LKVLNAPPELLSFLRKDGCLKWRQLQDRQNESNCSEKKGRERSSKKTKKRHLAEAF